MRKSIKYFSIALFASVLASCNSDDDKITIPPTNPIAQRYLIEYNNGEVSTYARFQNPDNMILKAPAKVAINGTTMQQEANERYGEDFDYYCFLGNTSSYAYINLSLSDNTLISNTVDWNDIKANFPASLKEITTSGISTLQWEGVRCLPNETFFVTAEGINHTDTFQIATGVGSVKLNLSEQTMENTDSITLGIHRSIERVLMESDQDAEATALVKWFTKKRVALR